MTATSEATAPSALNFDQLLGKTPPEKDHTICLDGAARTRLLKAEVDLADAQRRLALERDAIAARHADRVGPAPAPGVKLLTDVSEAEQAVKEATDAARLHAITLHLRGLGQHDYDELMSEYPPTDEQIEKAKADAVAVGIENPPKPAYDPDEFQPALIARCITNMKMTQEQAKQLKASPGWNSRDWLDLFYGCQDVCAIGGHVDLGNGSSSTRKSGPSSPTSSPKASPTPSS